MSEELRSDRQIADFRLGQNKVGGSVGYESSTDDAFTEALRSSALRHWMPSKTTGQATIGATVGTTGSGFTFVTGDVIVASGFTNAGNNGRFRLTAATATVLTATPLDGQTMVVETAAAAAADRHLQRYPEGRDDPQELQHAPLVRGSRRVREGLPVDRWY